MASLLAHSAAEPFRARLIVYLKWSLGLTLLFVGCYSFTNWFADQRAYRFTFYWDWELGIPFVPWVIYVYGSFQALVVLPLFVLDIARLRRFGQAFAAATLVAAILHILLPADLGWHRPAAVDSYPVYGLLFNFDRPHNLMPSLHVAYGALTAMVVWGATRAIALRVFVAFWLLILLASVFLVHQHHLADVISGLGLAAVCYRIVYLPSSRSK